MPGRATLLLLGLAAMAGPTLAADATGQPLRLNIGLLEVIEIRSNSDIAAYRTRIDGQARDEGRLADQGIRQLFMSVDPYHRYAVNLRFAEGLHAMLRPDFAGIENQCSHSQLTIPPGQRVELAGWTSIYRLTISDPCQKREHSLEIQIMGTSPP